MTSQFIVDNLLENGPEFIGPPEPDNYQKAVGANRALRDLHDQTNATLAQLDTALQFERQLKKHGVTKDDVSHYITADQKDPNAYLGVRRETVPNPNNPDHGTISRLVKPTYPPRTILGMTLKDGRKIMFDFPIVRT